MTGDALSWLLFWLGAGVSIVVGIITSILVSIVFLTLQSRRDLQKQLDEIWLRSVKASNLVHSLRDNQGELRPEVDAQPYVESLNDEWRRSQRIFRFSLSDEQFGKLENAINAISGTYSLMTLRMYDRFWRRYQITVTTIQGERLPTTDATFGDWAEQHGTREDQKDFSDFSTERHRNYKLIQHLLFFDPEKARQANFSIEAAPSIPTELERACDFWVLFAKTCRWVVAEPFASFARCYRDEIAEQEELERK